MSEGHIRDLIEAIHHLIARIDVLTDAQENLIDTIRELEVAIDNANLEGNQPTQSEEVVVVQPATQSQTRDRPFQAGERIRIIHPSNSAERTGAVTRTAPGRVFFRFDITGRHSWRRIRNVRHLN